MDAQQDLPRVPTDVTFRVLIIGRANAGKTSILQRVCDTTESPETYTVDSSGNRTLIQLDPSAERGEHNIEHEIIFTNHQGYVFHDSRGFEAGAEDELKTVQDFVRRKSHERGLNNRLHAIWYCIPMDNDRPELDLKHLGDICPDKNVPLIAVFTKYEQFRRDVRMKLEDQGRDPALFDADVERIFNKHYLANLTGSTPFVRLEKMHRPDQRCTDLIEKTANALSGSVVSLLLLAVQKGNLELNIKQAVEQAHAAFQEGSGSTEGVIRICILAFPSIWFYEESSYDLTESAVDRFYDDDDLPYIRADLEIPTEGNEWKKFSLTRTLVPKLKYFLANGPILELSDITHHELIATILVLEHACILYASQSQPTSDDALDKAYSRYQASHIHDVVVNQFPAHPRSYSILEFTEFIFKHRL